MDDNECGNCDCGDYDCGVCDDCGDCDCVTLADVLAVIYAVVAIFVKIVIVWDSTVAAEGDQTTIVENATVKCWGCQC